MTCLTAGCSDFTLERALLTEASTRGLSPDEFLSQMVIAHAGTSQESCAAIIVPEDGVPVLRTGQPLSAEVVNEVLEAVCREREQGILGLAN